MFQSRHVYAVLENTGRGVQTRVDPHKIGPVRVATVMEVT
jgi:hypothetical protein